MHDIIVIGAGPAGLAAAAYTLRHHLTTLLIAPDLAGKARFRLRVPWLQAHEAIIGEETVEQLGEASFLHTFRVGGRLVAVLGWNAAKAMMPFRRELSAANQPVAA